MFDTASHMIYLILSLLSQRLHAFFLIKNGLKFDNWSVGILKDKCKGNEVSNYSPITCLPRMWKLLTGIVADEIYNHLEEDDLVLEEQKGCRRNTRGTKD